MKCIYILLACSICFGEQTVEYGWEDGGTILGSFNGLTDEQNVSQANGTGPYDGNYMLSVSEEMDNTSTPQAWLGWITDLSNGDAVTACFYGYDTTPEVSPSLRIWGNWTSNDDITSYKGSASGSPDYLDGSGWSQLCHTFSVDSDGWEEGEGLLVQARLYGDPGYEHLIDNLSITASDNATITVPSYIDPVEGCIDPNATNYDPNANTDDGSCEYDSSVYTIAQIQESNQELGSDPEYDCYPTPYRDQMVTTSGIVTAVKPGAYPNFYIQDPNASSWSGIYVYDGLIDPIVGDEISITALAVDYFGVSELTEVAGYDIISQGNSMMSTPIEAVQLGVACSISGEMYEGMFVTVSDVELEYINEYDSWYVNDGTGTVKIDNYIFDGDWPVPSSGDIFESISGIVHYYQREYVIYPRFSSDIQTDSSLPVADAGSDQVVTPGQEVTLDGSDSYTQNGTIIGYEWSYPDGYNFGFDENSSSITFDAPDVPGDYIFTLTIFTDLGSSDSDQVTVTVMPILSIYDINYTDQEIVGSPEYDCYPTPYIDQVVTTTGIVTAVKPGEYPNFYLEDPNNDMWSGIYVYDTSISPSVGDEIILTAMATEQYSQTQLSEVSEFTILSVGSILQPQSIATGDIGTECNEYGEAYESMLVSIQGAEITEIDAYGTWTINDGSGDAKVDDYFFDGNWPSDGIGDIVNVTGVIEYAFSEYKIMPRDESDFEIDCVANADVNEDGGLNVLDIVQIVNHVVGIQSLTNECVADMNQDGVVNILDVVVAINIVISDKALDEASSVHIITNNSVLEVDSDGIIPAIEMTLSHGDNFSIDLTEHSFMSVYNTNDGITKLVVLYPESSIIFTANGDYDIIDILAANSYGEIPVRSNIKSNDIRISDVYPNPFNPVTYIDFELEYSANVNINIYNVLGVHIMSLAERTFEAGLNRIEWNAAEFSSGVYILQLESNVGIETRKLVLMK